MKPVIDGSASAVRRIRARELHPVGRPDRHAAEAAKRHGQQFDLGCQFAERREQCVDRMHDAAFRILDPVEWAARLHRERAAGADYGDLRRAHPARVSR
ncbi:hypothetical protein [Paraburkholderia youngii]|uniref:hypothetical protein n=1 Tax=Paraburkholderia youngii TaxID=2782701 RepID=UPI003D2243EF